MAGLANHISQSKKKTGKGMPVHQLWCCQWRETTDFSVKAEPRLP